MKGQYSRWEAVWKASLGGGIHCLPHGDWVDSRRHRETQVLELLEDLPNVTYVTAG